MSEDIFESIDDYQLLSLSPGFRLDDFKCEIGEYSDFLQETALTLQESSISKTHLLINKSTADIVAYMSLVSDSIKLSNEEKKEHDLDSLQFNFFPALKVGKLAVNLEYKQRGIKNIGTLMLELARGIAFQVNNLGVACKFLTLDADVEHNPSVIDFYIKNGFRPNETINKKNRRTISMRLHINDDEGIMSPSKTGTEN